VDGEVITGASVRLGYVHRGIEKACEERSWVQCQYLIERICVFVRIHMRMLSAWASNAWPG